MKVEGPKAGRELRALPPALPASRPRGRRPVAAALGCCALRLARERRPRGRGVGLALERALRRRAAPVRRRPRRTLALARREVALGGAPRALLGALLLRRRERDAGAARLGEADRDGLRRRTSAVLPALHVLHLLVHELAGDRKSVV